MTSMKLEGLFKNINGQRVSSNVKVYQNFWGLLLSPVPGITKQMWTHVLLSSITAAALMHKKPPQSVGHDHRHPAVSIKDFAKHSKQMQKDSHHAITEEYKVSFFYYPQSQLLLLLLEINVL